METKVFNLLVKWGHNEKTAKELIDRNLQWAMKAYPEAKAAKLADVCRCC